MRSLAVLVLSFVLSGCSLSTQPSLAFPTATRASELPAQLPTATLAPTQTTAGAPTVPPSDPFAGNFIQLTPPASCAGLTPAQTEGPYFKAGSPERQSLLQENMQGEKLIVAGYVLDQDCQPIPGALLDFWQADSTGAYDNSSFNFRGHQFTDAQGRYFLETVVPGEYPGRTEHIHVKVQPPNGQLVTTQLYFPNVSANSGDSIFDPALLVTIEEREGLFVAYYNFVLSR